jgi:small subunit ribosomal protein S21
MNQNDEFRPLEVILKPGESIEKAIKKLSKKIKKDGVLEIVKSKRSYEKPSEKRRRKNKERKQVLKRLHLEQMLREESENFMYSNFKKKQNNK